jgi:putative oxidoreductase
MTYANRWVGTWSMAEPSELPKILPALAWYRPFEPFAYAFIRFCTGAFVVTHGASRLFYSGSTAELGSLAHLPASTIGTFELVGGAMLAIGLLTRPIALLLMIEWLCIAVAVPLRPGASYLMLGATPHYPAMVAAFCFAFVLGGGGYYSLDRSMGKEI